MPAFARTLPSLDNLILVDSHAPRAATLARMFNVTGWSADHQAVIRDVEAAIVAVPTHLHYPVAMAFLSQGVHVLCEKPLAQSAPDAKAMIAQAHRTGAVLAANYTRRLYASYRKVKELLAEGTLGRPLSIKFLVGEDFTWPTVSGFYFNPRVSSRGVLLDRGSHKFDLICWWLGGKPQLLSSQNDSFGGPEAVAHVTFSHYDCRGEVKLSVLGRFPGTFVVECESATIEGDIYDFGTLFLIPRFGPKTRLRLRSAEKLYWDFGPRLVTNFIDAVTARQPPLVSGSDVLASVEFVDECYEAATRFEMPWYKLLERDRES